MICSRCNLARIARVAAPPMKLQSSIDAFFALLFAICVLAALLLLAG